MTLPPITPLDADLEGHLVAERDATIEQLLELVRIPSVSALPQHADDMVTTAEWIAGRAAPARRRRRRGRSDGAAPDRHRPDPPGARGAHRHRLLPLRRAAGRPTRPVGARAVRAVRARRPDGRPRHVRRQGPDRDAPGGDRGAPGGRAGRAGQPQVRLRGRGGVGSESLDTWIDGEPRPAGREPRGHQRHGLLRGQPADADGRPARDRVRPDRCRRIGGRPALGRLRRGGREPGERARHDHRGAQGTRRPDPRPRLLRRGPAADRRGAGGDARRCRSTRRSYRAELGVPALVGEQGFTDLERAAPGRRST